MHICSKWRSLRMQELELQQSKHNQSTDYEHKVQRTEKLGLYTVVNLGPRGSKGKVIKIERNCLRMRCQMDCQESR